MIALIDYGAGNLTSVRKALSALDAHFMTPHAPDALGEATAIVVPGVGHFEATRAIDAQWRTAIRSAVERGTALLGICLGMQWLFEGSDEARDLPGLGIFAGTCVRLQTDGGALVPPAGGPEGPSRQLKVPHVGWNSLLLPRASAILAGVAPDAQVYFTHSYVAPVVAETVAVTTHGAPFSAAVERGRIAGVQFHPEKSGDVGLRVLRNFVGAL